MSFNVKETNTAYIILVFCTLFSIGKVWADESKLPPEHTVSFTVVPEQCVTLREGRNCFAELEFHWRFANKQDICLFKLGEDKKINCWKKSLGNTFSIKFESAKSVTYQLRTISNNTIVAETQVEVSWQHKSIASKRRWRLF